MVDSVRTLPSGVSSVSVSVPVCSLLQETSSPMASRSTRRDSISSPGPGASQGPEEKRARADDSDDVISLFRSDEDEFDEENDRTKTLQQIDLLFQEVKRSLGKRKLDKSGAPSVGCSSVGSADPQGTTTGRDPNFKWPQLVAFARDLHGLPLVTGPSRLLSASGPFLGRGDQEEKPAVFFPFSPAAKAIIEKAFFALAGKNSSFSWDAAPADCSLSSERPSLASLSGDFDPNFHVDRLGDFSAFSASPSSEELAALKDSSFKPTPVLTDLEALSKRTLLTLSTLECMVGTLHKQLTRSDLGTPRS